jgi:pro-sigmaK processing inhibitor BofA
MMFSIIKKLVLSICLLYTINVFISRIGKIIPINIYTIILVYFFDFLGIIAIIYFKYYW